MTECSLFLKMVLYEGGRGPWTQSGFDELEKDVLSQAMDFVELFKEYIVWVTKTKIPEVKKNSISKILRLIFSFHLIIRQLYLRLIRNKSMPISFALFME